MPIAAIQNTSDGLSSIVKGVTLLYHEATFDRSLAELAEMTGHSTTLDAARTALEADAGSLDNRSFFCPVQKYLPLVDEAKTYLQQHLPRHRWQKL